MVPVCCGSQRYWQRALVAEFPVSRLTMKMAASTNCWSARSRYRYCALGKTFAHWLLSGLPLVLISPLLAMTYRLPADVMGVLALTLLLGTLCLSLLGSIGAALTVGLHRRYRPCLAS